MPKTSAPDSMETKRELVRQVAASSYISRSSRLRDMFVYVCSRVLDDDAEDIREQEVGQEVFGRPANYDTAADNTVRVHASMLRKRVGQYFENEGAQQTLVIEIPRGNYAPVFRERVRDQPEPPALREVQAVFPEPIEASVAKARVPTWIPYGLSVFFAATTAFFFARAHGVVPSTDHPPQVVAGLWSQIFPHDKQTDLVLGDATLGTVQDVKGQPVSLAEYFDRSYLTEIEKQPPPAGMDRDFTKAFLLKRQVNYGEVSMLARMAEMARSVHGDTRVRFARDYSFRELKTDSAILFGTPGSDLWMEPFLPHETLRWKLDESKGFYYPVDTLSKPGTEDQYNAASLPDGSHQGFATLALLPNLGGSGNVLILSATGGTTMNAMLDFLWSESLIKDLRNKLIPNAPSDAPLPHFEALIRANGRNGLPHGTDILIARRIQ